MNRRVLIDTVAGQTDERSFKSFLGCYKLFRREVLAEIAPRLREDRFGFEPEVTALVAKVLRRQGGRLAECAIRYRPRTFSEGKKIGYRDGLRALWCVVKYNLLVR